MTIPGKFEGCQDQELAQILYDITLEGCCPELGDVETIGWYASVDHKGEWFIVYQDSSGFFTYQRYDTQEDRDKDWNRLEDWVDGLRDEEDNT